MKPDQPSSDSTRPRRRWCQYRLRTLLLATLVCAILFGHFGSRWRRHVQQQEIVAEIQRLGGYVSVSVAPSEASPVAKLVGPWYDESLPLYIDLSYTKATNHDLAMLRPLAAIEELRLDGTTISDEGLAHLGRRPELTTLTLEGTQITGRALAWFERIPNLVRLNLMHTRITDAEIAHLGKLRQLESVALQGTLVTLEGAEKLRAARPGLWVLEAPAPGERERQIAAELTRRQAGVGLATSIDCNCECFSPAAHDWVWVYILDLNGETRLDDTTIDLIGRLSRLAPLVVVIHVMPSEGLQLLRRLPHLQALNLAPLGNTLGDEDLAHVASISGLRLLNLDGNVHVSDEGLKILQALTELDELNLFGTRVSDSGLRCLAQMNRLRKLDLCRTQVTDAGLTCVAELSNLEELHLGVGRNASWPWLSPFEASAPCTTISDKGLANLAELANLKSLEVTGCAVTDAGLVHLARLARLEELLLANTRITDAGLTHLKGLANLTRLDLDNTEIEGAGLEHLAALVRLESLSLRQQESFDWNSFREKKKLGDVALKHVGKLTSLRILSLDGANITDAGLVHLKPLENLEFLDIACVGVTDDGVAELQKSLPNLQIWRY